MHHCKWMVSVRVISLLVLTLWTTALGAQEMVRINKQRSFPQSVPPGDYSGITWLGGSDYAAVCDKTNDAYLRFSIDIDSLSGDIRQVRFLGKQPMVSTRRDAEDIVFVPQDSTLFICCESDNEVWEYRLDGSTTGRKLMVPAVYKKATGNCGLEALAYDAVHRRFWIVNESTMVGDGEQATASNSVANRLRLQAFGCDMQPLQQYCYLMEPPKADKPAYLFAMGVSALTAMDDGRLLVLEREFYVPKGKLGAYAYCRLFCVEPEKGRPVDTARPLADATPIEKKLVCEWRTSLSLLNHGVANYEGMCLGPRLLDGRQTLLLINDTQEGMTRHGIRLKEYIKVLILESE